MSPDQNVLPTFQQDMSTDRRTVQYDGRAPLLSPGRSAATPYATPSGVGLFQNSVLLVNKTVTIPQGDRLKLCVTSGRKAESVAIL